jgi:lysophospholipase L1-like esterase
MMRFISIAIVLLFSPLFSLGQNDICLGSQDFKIVVLGSSTSAGSGASTIDSAWVNRYREYLQSINPNNEVVNFGVGGYNTYRIMRTGFIPPPGRPNPDIVRNITAAINESPDAIIVNMPSNDVSLGFSYIEQMDNLDSIVEIADLNNIPIWICTTQPRNFADTNKLNLQWEVKDSIYAHFNPYTIDFWSTIAMPDYTINPTYNSGDGVHLNDLGHGLLFQRVVNTGILDSLFEAPTFSDFAILDVVPTFSPCGDSITTVEIILGNVGTDNFDSTYIYFSSENTISMNSFADSILLIAGLASCESDTLQFILDTYSAGTYETVTSVWNSLDSNSINDSLFLNFGASGHPDLVLIGDTLCDDGQADLIATVNVQDTVFWYDDFFAINPIGFGPSFTTTLIDTTTSFYAQAVRGNLFYVDDLHSTLNSTINWNGTMFDIVAHEELFIDSFDVKINSLGMQAVEIYFKSGTYQGFELDLTPWTLLDTAAVNVLIDSVWTSVPIGNLHLFQDDTVGIYIQMANPNSRLSYTSVSNEQVRSTPELTMVSGSGISHNYSDSYYPRDWSGGIFYHFGEKPLGDCATDRLEVLAYVSEIELNSGNDTIIDITDTLWVNATPGMTSYNWSIGGSNSSVEIIAADLGIGIHYIDVYAFDSLNCDHYDQFIVGVANLVGVDELAAGIKIYPSPTSGWIKIDAPEQGNVSFHSIDGSEVYPPKSNGKSYDLSQFANGVYTIRIESEYKVTTNKIIKTD